MPDELTEEELQAFRALASTFSPGMGQLYAQAAPVEVAPPVAVAPPVRPPIPDWARHATMGPPRGAGVVSSFDPTTGQRSMSFGSSVPTQVDPLEDIRKQINAVQFKTAQEALDAATQFQALRAYQRDLEAGKDPTRWLPLLFKKSPSAMAGVMRERRLAAPPSVTNINGYDVLTGGGGSARVIPKATPAGPVQAFPVLDEDGKPMEDFVAVPSGTGRGMTVRLRRREGQSQSANEISLLRRINDAEDELSKIPTVLSTFEDSSIEKEKDRKAAAKKPFEEAQKRRADLRKQIDGWRAELRSGKPAASPSAPKSPATNEVERLTKDGRRAVFNADTKEFIRYAD